jgi:hypothetical protein
VACLASLPLASFVFTFYPEMMGAVLVVAVVQHVIAPTPLTRSKAVAIGVALGWLVWLQVRFAVLAATLFVWVIWTFRRDRHAWLPVFVTSGLVVGLYCFYVYHVTGSILPSALYDATPDPGFRTGRLSTGLTGVLFDRENGLFALAPMFLLALPGLGIMLRDDFRSAAVVLTLFLALMIPVAGHGYETSGTSPLRHMVAVVPLAAVPVAAWLRAVRGRLLWSAVAVVLLLISVQMAVAYNLRNDKAITQTIAAGISGWDPSFAFPLLRRTQQAGFDARSLAVWEMLSVAAVAVGFWAGSKNGRHNARPAGMAPTAAIATALAIVPLAGWLAIATGGPRRELRLLKTPQRSSRECHAQCAARPGSLRIGTVPTE